MPAPPGTSSAIRRSGIVVETSGSASLDSEREGRVASALGALPPPRSGRPRRRGRSRVVTPATGAEAEAIREALAAAQLERIDAIPLRTGAAPAEPAPPRRRRGRGAPGAVPSRPRTRPRAVSTVSLGVPLERNERTVVLLEQDGVYSWHVPEAIVKTPRAPSRGKGRRRARAAARPASGAAGGATAYFRLELPAGRVAAAPAPGRSRRRGLRSLLIGKAVAFVFRFVAKPLLKGATKFLERHVAEGPVHVSGPDPAAWTLRAPGTVLPLPSNGAPRAPRVLLLVHGTFSSTVGSFGALAGSDAGRAFLDAALRHYDLVLGWNHRTLSATPKENAHDLLAWMRAQKWTRPPVLDAVAFSRGGLVLRSLVEDLLPGSSVKASIGRVVFVGCTNGGTELARPANWHRLADIHMNLVAAGARALSAVPGLTVVGVILAEGIQGLGALLKVLATSAVDDDAIPGLSAMNPEGRFVTGINQRQVGQPSPEDVYYCAITSNFDPDEARDAGHAAEMPPGFLLTLADKGADVLHGRPNDLVVHVEAMTRIDPDVGAYVRERLDYGTNGVVHHCRYFAEADTAEALARWLQVASA